MMQSVFNSLPRYQPLTKELGLSRDQALACEILDTTLGQMVLAANQFGLSHLTFLPGPNDSFAVRPIRIISASAADKQQAKVYIEQAKRELHQYLEGRLSCFSTPLAPVGTLFQHRVWQALLAKPFGCSCSYSDIAMAIDNPKAVRAVGTANGANSIAIIIPCHRIIGKNGLLTGYAYGLGIKQRLLALEAAAVRP